VGIPGRIIDSHKAQTTKEREQIANKMGFNAYGATADMPDPIAHAINHMLDHIHSMDKQLDSMKKVLNASGIKCEEQVLPSLDDCEIKE